MEAGKKRLATLVGCNYPNTKHELHGCINDVHSMRRSLVSRFGFSPENIVVLTDEPSSVVFPTGENIKRALRRMIDSAESGDLLFFHYSGHGTTVPAAKPRHGSRYDEAIVPCDFNLITDVDFRKMVNSLPAGVSLTIISDSCHSGGLIDKEKEQIGPSTAINNHHTSTNKSIPYDSILSHLTTLSGLNSPHIGDHLTGLFRQQASLNYFTTTRAVDRPVMADNGILLSGCQANETSADMCTGDVSGAYGAFSNAIGVVLEEEKGVISNRELLSRVRAVMRRQGFEQHPCLYCSDQNAVAPFLWQPAVINAKDEEEEMVLPSGV